MALDPGSPALANVLLTALPDAVAIVDAQGVLRYASAATTTILGYPVADLVGRDAFELVHPDDHLSALEGFESTCSAADSSASPLLVRLRHVRGTWIPTEVIATNHLDDEHIGGLLLTIRDVSASMRTDEALRESEERYRLIVELAREGIWVVDAGAITTYANRALARMLDTTVNDLIGRSMFEFMDDEGRAAAAAQFDRADAHHAPEEHDVRLVTSTGRVVWTRMHRSALLSGDGGYRGALALVTDVTERRALEHRLEREARSDALTGLANRHTLFETLRATLGDGRLCAVLYIDLDDFKEVNDTHGHRVGDEVLRVVARRIGASVRGADTVARVGGDEFVVVAAGLDEPGRALAIADRVRKVLCLPVRLQVPIGIGATIGVAFAEPDDDPDAVLTRADLALYRAKAAGGGRIEVATGPLAVPQASTPSET